MLIQSLFVTGKKINEGFVQSFFISEQQDTVNDTTSELSGLPTLKKLIQFVFGDPFLPKGTKLKISFWGAHFSDAGSCFGILHLPCDHVNYSSFKRAVSNCINCQFVGYGRGWKSTSTVREFECELLLSSKSFSIQKVWGNRFLHCTAQDFFFLWWQWVTVYVAYEHFCVHVLDH